MDESLELHQQRHLAVLKVLIECDVASVIDLGCGDGKFLQLLLADPRFTKIAGVDLSARNLELAAGRLRLDDLPEKEQARIQLFQSSLLQRDLRLQGYEAGVLSEVIEHIEPSKLSALERVVFGQAQPRCVVVTTPNREYNRLFPRLLAGRFRHTGHRFEWTREEFRRWAERVAGQYGYRVRFAPVGAEDPQAGAPTQMSVFSR